MTVLVLCVYCGQPRSVHHHSRRYCKSSCKGKRYRAWHSNSSTEVWNGSIDADFDTLEVSELVDEAQKYTQQEVSRYIAKRRGDIE